MASTPKMLPQLEVIDLSVEGKGIARYQDLVVFIELAVAGDVVDVEVLRNKKSYLEARAVRWHVYSKHRVQAPCEHFGTCGGCKWQQLDYAEQLRFKAKFAQDALTRIAKIELPEPEPILGSAQVYAYRNKLEFSATSRAWVTQNELQQDNFTWQPGLGFHLPGRFDKILHIKNCALQPEPSNKIRNSIYQLCLKMQITFYNARTKQGSLRTVMIRTAQNGACMVVISFFEWLDSKLTDFKNSLIELCPEIQSLWFVHNTKGNDTLEGLRLLCVYGSDAIYETLGTLQFKISPASFFQTNTPQAKKLYDLVADWSALQAHEIVYDLYTGTGTIGLYLASKVKRVIGIDYVEAAILDAKTNAQCNGIENAHFFSGDMCAVFTDAFIAAHGYADVVIVDPPRAGMHGDVIETLLKHKPKSIIYVSCNPATQARDMALLNIHYKVDRVQALDLFPQTTHVEQVVRLQLR